jgi:ATP-binding protein involved in chromosome partitioning
MLTEEAVLHALATVKDPEIHRDLVSLGMIKDLTIDGSNVSFEVVMTTPACPLKSQIERECREALARLPGIGQVSLRMGSNVVASRGMTGPGGIPGVKNVVAVASGKGGVGKSTVSVNLAVALAQAGAATGLLDADLYGPSIPILTGTNRMPENNGHKLLPVEAHGVRLMSLGFLMPDGAPVIWRGPMVSGAIQQFLQDVEWGSLDYLLVDLPPGTGDAQLTLAQSLPLAGAVIVMTPQDLAMHIASKALAMFQQLKVPILGIIENMSGFVCPHCGRRAAIFRQGGARRASQHLGVPFLGEIPLDPRVCQTSDRGEPIVTSIPDSPVAEAFRRVSAALAERVGEEGPSVPVIRLGK